jgi:hypothetical protein
MKKTAIAATLAGISLGTVGFGGLPAQAAPADISPQRVAGAYAADGLHVFVRGTTGYLYEKVVAANGTQSNWIVSHASVSSSPAATVDHDGRIYLAARATNGNVLYRWRQPDGDWTAWSNLGGTTYGAPALQASPAQSELNPVDQVMVAAHDSAGRTQIVQLKWNSTQAAQPGTNTWHTYGAQVSTAAPNLSSVPGCQGPDDQIAPNQINAEGRSAAGKGIGRSPCESPNAWPVTINHTIASGTDTDSVQRTWYRGTDGALWVGDKRIGVPATGRRIACTPTVSGYPVAPFAPSQEPTTILVRDDLGASWIYTPPASGPAQGGSWTSLGGIAT